VNDAQALLSYPVGIDGTVTRVLDTYAGERSVVFIHGLGARADRWRRNLPPLAAAGFRGIALDLPGHGFATKDTSFAHGVEGYSRFVAALIRELGLERPVLVGTSLGGHVAAAIACRQLVDVRALILIGATGLFPIGAAACERLATRAQDRSLAGTRSKAQTVFFDPAMATDAFVHEEHRINNSPGSDGVFAALGRYFVERLDRDAVGELLATMPARPPLALVWGAQDRSVPITVGREAAKLLSTPLHEIAGAAHAPYFEKPEQFNPLMVSFLNAAFELGKESVG
jgi:2-hydroxy-6-oxonona-2,4-dienedioate hydrolase